MVGKVPTSTEWTTFVCIPNSRRLYGGGWAAVEYEQSGTLQVRESPLADSISLKNQRHREMSKVEKDSLKNQRIKVEKDS